MNAVVSLRRKLADIVHADLLDAPLRPHGPQHLGNGGHKVPIFPVQIVIQVMGKQGGLSCLTPFKPLVLSTLIPVKFGTTMVSTLSAIISLKSWEVLLARSTSMPYRPRSRVRNPRWTPTL